MLKKLIICGSNSKKSKSFALSEVLSRELLTWAIYLNSSENIPLISNEVIEKNEFPPTISFLVEKIKEHQILIFVFPQYNYNFSGFMKNVLDWCSISSRKIFHSKRLILVGVSQTKIGESEFKQIVSWTFSSLGASQIIFLNYTPKTEQQEIIQQIKKYV
ncbi:NADPH-dependent FMN reductase [Mycoplasma ovis str. Michigan]|uniref:NADPH-dependent FMN reductase n=1 Tax=Mycoplasma ovis str. Michigan TaxID=1415773 RepID=A0ABM5P0B7_9MOLU|nr:NAD(P)H-dependent oxidoreductase [Mycoplasma ovis]AHC39859.1 NADPH-dependent FMN reductase [Mycoplasma ovis str. Michigan]